MKKILLLSALLIAMAPCMAQNGAPTTTTTTVMPREMVTLDKMIDRAKLEEDAKRKAINAKYQENKANLEAKRADDKASVEAKKQEIQNKIDTKQAEYKKQEEMRAQKRAEIQKQNQARQEQLKRDMDLNKNTIHSLRRQTIEDIDTVKADVANDVTEMRKEMAEHAAE